MKKIDALLKALNEKYPGEKPTLYDIDPEIIVKIHKRADAIMKKSKRKK